VTWGGAAAIYLLVVLWGPTHALRTWWGILLVAALLAAGIVILRRQTLAEFPQAGLEEHASLRARVATTVGGAAHRVSSARHHDAPAGGNRSTADELSRLAELRANGAISEEEYEQAKKIALTP
jgi:hypothetical protein